jgi:ribonuclease PH
MRKDGRQNTELREIKLAPGYIKHVPGSVLIEQGDTRVVCTATYDNKVPHFLKNSDKGWIQAEYAMIPGSTGNFRVLRERQRVNNRHIEIQRLIGRGLRTTINLKEIAGITLSIDCDVVQADGGTRCAALNGGVVALVKALRHLVFENVIKDLPEVLFIAAVSIGVVNNEILVDLDYREDFKADADINIVSTEKGDIVEVQALGEEAAISQDTFLEVMDIGIKKNLEIIETLKKCL